MPEGAEVTETAESDDILRVQDLEAFYDETHVLHEIALAVPRGAVVTLLGRNGAGKTTTLKCIIGMLERRFGSIEFAGRQLIGLRSNEIARLGIAYCPEERGIFASLTVEENLLLPPVIAPGGMSLPDIFGMFPNLRERLASQGSKLSGGEQQMLAIGRILRTGASLLLLDEPTEGLAPVIVEQIRRVIDDLKRRGLTILLVEQNVDFAGVVADRHYILENGHIVDCLTRADLGGNRTALQNWLGV